MSEQAKADHPESPTGERRPRKLGRAAVLAVAALAIGGLVEHTVIRNQRPEKQRTVRLANEAALAKQFKADSAKDGYAVSVQQPTHEQTLKFRAKFQDQNGKPFAKAPKLTEVVKISDTDKFTIYNTTGRPVDIPFIRYTAKAIKDWGATHRESGVQIMGNVTTKLRPVSAPHDIVLTETIPQAIVDPSNRVKARDVPSITVPPNDPIGHGVSTAWVRTSYNSSKNEDQKARHALGANAEAYNARKFLAVEMCQSMYTTYDTRVLPGRRAALAPSLNIITGENPAAKELNNYAAEEVCNSVPRLTTAVYVDGIVGARALRNEFTTSHDVSVLDGHMADAQLPDFARLKQAVTTQPEAISAIEGQNTPTLQYS